jgi:hypothetical protein
MQQIVREIRLRQDSILSSERMGMDDRISTAGSSGIVMGGKGKDAFVLRGS